MTQETVDTSSILEKVRKLLSLSQQSASANEAAAAAGQANKIMDKYRLSMADVELSQASPEGIEDDMREALYETGRIIPWKSALVSVLCHHYGVAHWIDHARTQEKGRKYSEFRMAGRRSDMEMVRYMFTWLMAECLRLSDIEAKGKGHVYVFSYCEGFVAGVQSQLASSREEAKQEAQISSAALVKFDQRFAEAKDWMDKKHNLVYRTHTSYRRQDAQGYMSGKTRGENVHLGASLGPAKTKMLGR